MGTGDTFNSELSVNPKFQDIYIGEIIKQKVDERHISYAEFARLIHCARTSLYHIFNSKNIDIERLLLISEVLQYNFIEEVYLKRIELKTDSRPYILLPFDNKTVDYSHLPAELLELLKSQLP